MVKNNQKSGFSLFEACVVMLIVGIFVALCANAYSKKHVTYQESDGHGRYECYRNSAGTLMQYYVENNNRRSVTGNSCVFRPPRYAKYLFLNAVGGGSSTAPGEFKTVFYSSLDKPLTVEPGGVNGSTSIKLDGTVILSAAAGQGSLNATSSEATEVRSCTFDYKNTDCDGTPTCQQKGSDLKISFCNESGYVTNILSLEYIKQYKSSYSGNTLIYKDLSDFTGHGITPESALTQVGNTGTYNSFYTIRVTFNTDPLEKSEMVRYLEQMGIEGGIASANPGGKGKPGGVVIMW